MVEIRNRRDIQVLRAFALMGVLFFHLGPKWFPNGYLGVDMFFVISGFLLASRIRRIGSRELSNQAARAELSKFLKRRFFRLAPALGFSIALGLVVTLIAAPVSEHLRFSTQAILGLFFLGNLGAQHFDSNYFNPSPSLFLHLWSLGAEFQLYVFFALGSFIWGRCRIHLKANRIILSLGALSFLPVILMQFAGSILSSFVFYSPLTRLWEFSAGVLAANVSKNYFLGNKQGFGLQYLLAFSLAIVLFLPLGLSTGFATILIVVCTAFLVRLGYRENFISSRFLVWLGDRSYSIYLVHFPVIYLCKYSPISKLGPALTHQFLLLASIPSSILIGAMMYQFVEKKALIRKSELSLKFLLRYFSPILAAIIIIFCANSGTSLWSVANKLPTYGGYAPKACKSDWEKNKYCEIGDKNSNNSIILAGDSHAGHFANTLIQSIGKSGIKGFVWKDVSCIKKIETFDSENCKALRSEFYNELAHIKPRAILISFYITNDVNLNLLKKFVEESKLHAGTIISIEQTPTFPEAEKYFESPLLFIKYSAPEKRFKLSRMDNSMDQAYAAWEKILVDRRVPIIPTRDLFCNSVSCSRFKDGEWLYRDKNHLSLAGSQLLLSRFDQILLTLK